MKTVDIKQTLELACTLVQLNTEFSDRNRTCHIEWSEHEDEEDCHVLKFTFTLSQSSQYTDTILIWDNEDFNEVLEGVEKVRRKAMYLLTNR
jgi:hypothetical protein